MTGLDETILRMNGPRIYERPADLTGILLWGAGTDRGRITHLSNKIWFTKIDDGRNKNY